MIVSLGKKIIFSGKHMFQFFFSFETISWLFLYMLATYHWKGIHESYNFVLGSTSIIIHMKKLQSHKILDVIVPREHGCFWGNLGPFFFKGHGCSSGLTMCAGE
jgi:hypothetical protein